MAEQTFGIVRLKKENQNQLQMKSQYILFSEEAEDLPKDFEQHIAVINADVKTFVERSRSVSNTSHHTRDAHAKGYAALKAEFTIFDNLPDELAQGI